MDVDTARPVQGILPLSRDTDAREVALGAYAGLLELLEDLDDADWRAPTECPGWDVAAMVGHLIGAARACASMREQLRQQARGWRHAADFGGNALDAANELQVRDHAGLSPRQRIETLREIAPAAVRGRMRLPRPMRRVGVPLAPGGSTATGMPARLTLGHLMDVIYTRDVWLHTIDIVRATGRSHVPRRGVDGRIVEDVVAEWGRRHGEPFVLVLSGPVAGRFRQGEGGGHLHLDAVELCRVLSGRAEPGDVEGIEARPSRTAGLLTTRVVF
jgi:uncharacterized protein (TIGR03083 family)